MSSDKSRRGSALLNELSRAEAKIGTLEDFIRERERQLHVAVSRLRGGTGDRRSSRLFGNRRRRAGVTQDALLRMRTMSQDSFEHPDDGKTLLVTSGSVWCMIAMHVCMYMISETAKTFNAMQLTHHTHNFLGQFQSANVAVQTGRFQMPWAGFKPAML